MESSEKNRQVHRGAVHRGALSYNPTALVSKKESPIKVVYVFLPDTKATAWQGFVTLLLASLASSAHLGGNPDGGRLAGVV